MGVGGESGGALWGPVLREAVTEGAFVRAEAGTAVSSSKLPVRRQGGSPPAKGPRASEGL